MGERARFSGTGWAGLAYLGLAIAATWPMAARPADALLFAARRFDGYGTMWLGEHFWRFVQGQDPLLTSTQVAWPQGLDLRLADSFLFGVLYLPFRAFFSPVVAFNWFCIVAMAATGAAGWWFARRALNAPPLGAFACGLIVSFNSLAHTYRIEGEAYLLAGLFLPLFAGWLVIAAKSGEPRHGVLAGVMMGALAWSSGYYAVDGMIICAVLGLAVLAGAWGRPEGRTQVATIAAFFVTAVVLILPLAIMVGSALDSALAARFPEGHDPLQNVALDSASLTGLLVPLPQTAHLRQGRIAYVGLAPMLIAVSAIVVRKPREYLPWLLLSAIGMVLALGPALRLNDTTVGTLTLPYTWLVKMSSATLAYRMPARFLAVTYLGLGAMVALVVARLTEEGLGRAWRIALVAAVAIDGLFFTGFATDVTFARAKVPEGYEGLSGKGAVLDLWGHDRDLLRFAGLSAFYQVHHGQPVLADFTRAGDLQSRVGHRLALMILTDRMDDTRDVLEVLVALGVSDIALHTRSFRDSDSARLREKLATLCDAPTRRTDADVDDVEDVVEVFHIDERRGAPTRDEALALVDKWTEEGG